MAYPSRRWRGTVKGSRWNRVDIDSFYPTGHFSSFVSRKVVEEVVEVVAAGAAEMPARIGVWLVMPPAKSGAAMQL